MANTHGVGAPDETPAKSDLATNIIGGLIVATLMVLIAGAGLPTEEYGSQTLWVAAARHIIIFAPLGLTLAELAASSVLEFAASRQIQQATEPRLKYRVVLTAQLLLICAAMWVNIKLATFAPLEFVGISITTLSLAVYGVLRFTRDTAKLDFGGSRTRPEPSSRSVVNRFGVLNDILFGYRGDIGPSLGSWRWLPSPS